MQHCLARLGTIRPTGYKWVWPGTNAPADLKDIHLVIYTPADNDTPQRLAQLQDKSNDAAAEAP
ncbi:MAG TPA: hypothetical protein VF003_14655 [Pseudonocardiaceae bacterium]